MSDLAKTLANKALQQQIRRVLESQPGFQVDYDLPETLRDKLEELDRVVAARAKP
ncbi:hypothetical protein [Aureimonas sp. AU12]|uniref:hypothetical protein n=1 Tax=Aureimonas sp. AU12 TaxID=1638161 RepID=UPI000A560FF0|nr:hypothetical protein [Aureimonas sp. AU12]